MKQLLLSSVGRTELVIPQRGKARRSSIEEVQ